MKRNKFFILGLIAAFVAVLSLTLVSGTWAKYTQTVTGSANARVAKWEVQVNDAAVPANLTLNLFDSIKDSDGTTAETDVKSKNSDKVIAPGTRGSFEVKVSNASEVNLTAQATLTITNAGNIPLTFKYKIGDNSEVGLNASSFDSNGSVVISLGQIDLSETGVLNSETLLITWEWPFNGNDTTDTDLGKTGTAQVEVSVDLVFTQVD